MSVKQILLTALLVTGALAMPAPALEPPHTDRGPTSVLKSDRMISHGLEKYFAGGWCTFHIKEDMSNGLAVGGAFTDKIQITLYDNDHNVIGDLPQQNIMHSLSISMTSELPWTIEIGSGPNRGYSFAYSDQNWDTENTEHCSAGGWDIDVPCKTNNVVTQTSTDPGCMAQIAKGTNGLDDFENSQGHKDAEAFAMYAMATWVNTVYWYSGYLPKDRDTY